MLKHGHDDANSFICPSRSVVGLGEGDQILTELAMMTSADCMRKVTEKTVDVISVHYEKLITMSYRGRNGGL